MQQFKSESKKVLDLVINSIYSNKDVFLRELISNASDAIDKYVLARAAQGAPEMYEEPAIELAFDVEARTITVSDNGIGMTRSQLEEELGTIAKSSSYDMKHVEGMAKDSGVDIIGQFGVGFYSSFMVADHVSVTSRAFGDDEAYVWESDGVEGFVIHKGERAGHGTDVVLHLRDDDSVTDYGRFLSYPALEELVRRHSNYIRYPIYLEVSGMREVETPAGMRSWEPEFEEFTERRVLNTMVPIWAKPRDEVSQADYDEFYKQEFNDPHKPLRIISMHARGSRNCDVLLYVPSEPPADLYSSDYKQGLALYSSGVLIMEQCEQLLPEYLGFVRGVVDSPDLSLNVSREAMQEDEFLKAVAQQIEKRLLMEMEAMRDNEREEYVALFSNFGRIFKYALYATFGALNAKLEDLLLFFTANRDEPVTLREYREAMPGNQPFVFFASGDDARRLEASPSVTAVTERGFEVLLCPESIDELTLMTLREYAGIPIKNVTSDDLGLDNLADLEFVEAVNEEHAALFRALAEMLPADVVEVRASARLSSVPACISAKGPISLGLEKYFSSMPDEVGGRPQIQHVLELNPNHRLFESLKGAFAADDGQALRNYAQVLYGQSLLAEGLPLPDVPRFSQAVYDLLV